MAMVGFYSESSDAQTYLGIAGYSRIIKDIFCSVSSVLQTHFQSSWIEVLCWVPRAGPADRLQFLNLKNLASVRFTIIYIGNLRLKTGASSLHYSLRWFGDINCGMKECPTSYYTVCAYLRHSSSFKVVVKQGIKMNQNGSSDSCTSQLPLCWTLLELFEQLPRMYVHDQEALKLSIVCMRTGFTQAHELL